MMVILGVGKPERDRGSLGRVRGIGLLSIVCYSLGFLGRCAFASLFLGWRFGFLCGWREEVGFGYYMFGF